MYLTVDVSIHCREVDTVENLIWSRYSYNLVLSQGSHYASTEHLRGKSGCFASPNFPNRYPSQSRRRYKITVNPGFRIKLTFTTFSLDWSSSCRYDYLRIMEKDGSISKTLCGKYPGDFISKDNELMVEFQSVTSNHGFDARFFALTASEAAQLTTKRPMQITTPAPIASK